MPAELESSIDESFEISAVSRLTGVSTHTLRIWERRYGLVSPDRSDSKRRRYSREDIRHISLIKTLIDHGDSVGTIAKLTIPQLESRIRTNFGTSDSEESVESSSNETDTLRVAVAGTTMPTIVGHVEMTTKDMSIVAKCDSMEELEELLRPGSVDILIVERSTLFPEDIATVKGLADRLEARRCVIVYHFAQGSTIEEFDRDVKNLTALKAPVNAAELRLACLADIMLMKRSAKRKVTAEKAKELAKSLDQTNRDIPERMFTNAQLSEIAQISSVVQCECPHHLATILTSLVGFEKYSAECESRNEEDAILHAHLHQTTAEARHMMERTLTDVLKAEGIEIA